MCNHQHHFHTHSTFYEHLEVTISYALKWISPRCSIYQSYPQLLQKGHQYCNVGLAHENLETSVPSPHVTPKSQTLDASTMFSSPARWGPLDINKGVPHSLLLIPTPTHSFIASGSSPRRLAYCFASPVLNTTSPAPDAVGHAWTRTLYRKFRMQWATPGPEHLPKRMPDIERQNRCQIEWQLDAR